MIPDIGIMIGAYILTRMASFLSRKGAREESSCVKIFAAITIVIVLISVYDLIVR